VNIAETSSTSEKIQVCSCAPQLLAFVKIESRNAAGTEVRWLGDLRNGTPARPSCSGML